MNLGIMQGRLSPPIEGFQECPKDWKREFELLSESGVDYIDWVVTKKSWDTNPIFFTNVDDLSIGAICADNLIDPNIVSVDFLFDSLHRLAKAAIDNNISMLTIPLLEESDMSDANLRSTFCSLIGEIGDQYLNLNFSFEAELAPDEVLEIVEKRDNFFITYDTGNITSCGFDHYDYIKSVGHKINCVHLKDRTVSGTTVEPGTGDTNFKKILTTLREIGYNGSYTLQTARNKVGSELATIKNHVKYFKELYNG